jgi:Concanavalin A-like lectin/glucanases superfamily
MHETRVFIFIFILLPLFFYGSSTNPLVGHWAMDGNSMDSSSFNHQNIAPNQYRFEGSYIGLGLSLPSLGILAKNHKQKLTPVQCFTIEAWIRLDGESTGSCFIYEDENAYALGIEKEALFSVFNNKKWLPPNIKLEAGQWYFIAATFDGHWHRLYINGKEMAKEAATGKMNPGSNITIGKTSDQFKGILDEVKIFNISCSSAAIQAHFKAIPRVSAIWSFDNDTKDKSGFGHHGKRINGVGYRKGKINACLYFDGNNDYALFSNQNQLLDPGMNISIEAWIYCEEFKSEWQHIYDKYRSFAISIKGGKLALAGRGGWWIPENAEIKTQRWNHIVGTYSLNERKLYINGKLMGSQRVKVGATYGDAVYISSPYFTFHGRIDEVKLYSDTLSQTDVLTRYKANVP